MFKTKYKSAYIFNYKKILDLIHKFIGWKKEVQGRLAQPNKSITYVEQIEEKTNKTNNVDDDGAGFQSRKKDFDAVSVGLAKLVYITHCKAILHKKNNQTSENDCKLKKIIECYITLANKIYRNKKGIF